MSEVIDERVVSLELDNRNFEQNSERSLRTIDELKKGLNFNGAAKGLEEISYATKQVNMGSLSDGVGQVGLKFNAMYSIADQALRNITTAAMNAGKKIVDSLVIDPIKTGLSEYETQLGAIQTILANTKSKGSTLDDVNGALDELNKYADMTIYNFTEMTRNIGTFTAAGVDLDTSVSAIKGIANLAAVSGSTSQQASTAMYQLSQALASGTVKLMDWNSVVNAGMGGEVFQNALKETAKLHGVAIDQMIEDEGSFRETLKEGWLTSEILTDTLKKFTYSAEKGTEEWDNLRASLMAEGYTEKQAEEILELGDMATKAATEVKTATQLIDVMKESAQSGWAQTWEIIFGDFEEAKKLWTMASDVFTKILGDSANARNELLGGALKSGWDQLLGAGIFDEKGFSNFISGDLIAKDGKSLADLAKNGESVGETISRLATDGTITSDMLTTSVDKLTKQYEGYTDVQKKNAGITDDQIKGLKELNEQLQNGSISMEEFMEKMTRKSGRELLIESFVNIFKALGNILKPIKQAFDDIFGINSNQLYSIIQSFHDFTSKLIITEETMDKLRRTFAGVFAVFDIAWTVIKTLAGALLEMLGVLSPVGDGFLSVTANIGDALVRFRDFVKSSNGLTVFGQTIVNVFTKVVNIIKTFFNSITKKPDISWFEGFKNVLVNIWDFIKRISAPVVDFLGKVGKAIGDFIADKVNFDVVSKAFQTLLGGGFIGALTWLAVKLGSFIESAEKGLQLPKLTKFMDIFKDIGTKVSEVLNAVKGPIQEFQNSIKANAIKTIAIAIAILAGALVVLTLIDPKKLVDAVAAIGALFVILMAAFNFMTGLNLEGFKKSNRVMSAIVGMAIAVGILSLAMKSFAKMEWDEIWRGLTAMSLSLAALLGAMTLLSLIAKLKIKGIWSVIGMSIALSTLGLALKVFATMSWDEVWRGLVAMSLALTALVGAVTILSLLPKKKNKTTKNLIAIVGVLSVLALALLALGSMSWETIFRGVTAMGLSLTVLIGALAVMSKIKDATGSLKILGLTAILYVLAGALQALATLSWDEIWRSIVAMSLSLTALIASLAILSKIKNPMGATKILPMAVVLLAIGGALKKLGSMGWEGMWQSIIAMSLSLTALIASLAILQLIPSTANVAGLLAMTVGLLAIAGSLKILSTMGWDGMWQSLIAMGLSLAAVVGALAVLSLINPISATMASVALLTMAVALGALIPVILLLGSANIATIVTGILAIAGVIGVFTAATYLLAPVSGVLMTIAVALGVIGVACLAAGAGMMMLSVGVTALITAFAGLGSAGIVAMTAAITNAIKSFASLIPFIAKKIGEGIVEFCKAIGNGATAIGQAIVSVLMSALQNLTIMIPELARSLLAITVGILQQLATYVPAIVEILVEIVVRIIEAVATHIPKILQAIMSIMEALFNGVLDMLKSIGMTDLKDAILTVGLLAGLIVALSAITSFIPGAMLAVLGIGAVIAELALVLAAIGALTKIPGFQDLVNSGGSLLQSIGTAIGKFIGGIVGGIAEGVTSALPAMATDLSNFMTNLQPFLNGLSSISPETAQAGTNLAAAILGLMAANVISAISSWLTGGVDMVAFKSQLVSFGEGLALFAATTANIDAQRVGTAAEAAKNLMSSISSMPKTGGWWQKIAGEVAITEMANQFGAFGSGIAAFGTAVANIDPAKVSAGAEAGKSLMSSISSMPKTGGWWQKIVGEVQPGQFGTQLGELGIGVAKFAEATANIDSNKVRAGAEASTYLMDAMGNMNRSGGIINNIKEFFIGSADWQGFKTNLSHLGAGVKNFSEEVDGIVANTVKKGAEACSILVTALGELPSKGGIWDLDTETLGTKFKGVGKAIVDYVESSSDVSKEDVSAANDKLTTITNGLKGLSTEGIDSIVKSFEDAPSKIKNALSDALDSAIKTVESYESKFSKSGENLGKELSKGIESKKKAVIEAVTKVAEAASNELDSKTYYTSFYNAGADLVDGFINGIDSKIESAAKKSAQMAAAALQAAKSELDENSPSKKFFDIGAFAGEGFVNALSIYRDISYEEGANMADGAIAGLQEAISKNPNMFDEAGLNPTIKPVLDLSEVNRGYESMNRMFASKQSVGVMANVDSISNNMKQIQNGGTDDIVSSIEDLKHAIGEMSGDTYNINGVPYDAQAEVKAAFETIARFVKIQERR